MALGPLKINIPNIFVQKTRAKASEVNANFESIAQAVEGWAEDVVDAVDGLDGRVAALEAVSSSYYEAEGVITVVPAPSGPPQEICSIEPPAGVYLVTADFSADSVSDLAAGRVSVAGGGTVRAKPFIARYDRHTSITRIVEVSVSNPKVIAQFEFGSATTFNLTAHLTAVRI